MLQFPVGIARLAPALASTDRNALPPRGMAGGREYLDIFTNTQYSSSRVPGSKCIPSQRQSVRHIWIQHYGNPNPLGRLSLAGDIGLRAACLVWRDTVYCPQQLLNDEHQVYTTLPIPAPRWDQKLSCEMHAFCINAGVGMEQISHCHGEKTKSFSWLEMNLLETMW